MLSVIADPPVKLAGIVSDPLVELFALTMMLRLPPAASTFRGCAPASVMMNSVAFQVPAIGLGAVESQADTKAAAATRTRCRIMMDGYQTLNEVPGKR